MVKEHDETRSLEMSEEEYARIDMKAIPKGRITKDWQIHAFINEVPKGWQINGQEGGRDVIFRTSVTQKVKNIWGITEKVDAKLEFRAMKARDGYLLKGCKVDMKQSLDPIASGHEILTTILDRVAESDYTLACWE